MTMKNRYVNLAHISERKFRELLKLFSQDLTAVQISQLTGLNRNTVNRYVTLIRQVIVIHCEHQSPFRGEVEIDESFFGAKRVKGKRGRGALGKTIVFGLLKRNGKVYTEIIPNCSRPILQAIIKGHVDTGSIIHTDKWRGYNGLVDLGYKKHYRLDHGRDEFVRGHSHINGIESFWGFAKTRLTKFKGMNKQTFLLHLKETEFRFNHRKENLYKLFLSLFKKYPLN